MVAWVARRPTGLDAAARLPRPAGTAPGAAGFGDAAHAAAVRVRRAGRTAGGDRGEDLRRRRASPAYVGAARPVAARTVGHPWHACDAGGDTGRDSACAGRAWAEHRRAQPVVGTGNRRRL